MKRQSKFAQTSSVLMLALLVLLFFFSAKTPFSSSTDGWHSGASSVPSSTGHQKLETQSAGVNLVPVLLLFSIFLDLRPRMVVLRSLSSDDGVLLRNVSLDLYRFLRPPPSL